ncbi:MAG: PRC-barrel domain-containing protein [Oceanicaulis sp.]
MSKFLMSAAAAALMTAPAIAQAGSGEAQTEARGDAAASQTTSSRTAASGADSYDWNTDHDWVNAAVYGEDGEQVGVVDRVRMRDGGGGEVRALVLNTEGFLDQGMRHIRLLGDEATVIKQDALPAGWTVSRQGGENAGSEDESGEDNERRWWNWGRDDDAERQADANGAMNNFTLITLDFTNDEIAMMPEYVASTPARTTTSDAGAQSGADTETRVAADTTEDDSMTGETQRADARQATERAARTARQEASDDQAMAANAGQTGDPMDTDADTAMSDEDSEDIQSEYGNEIGEDASDGYDREVRAGRDDVGTSNDTGVNMQNGDAPDDIDDATLMDDEAAAGSEQSYGQASNETDDDAEAMNAGAAEMDRANRGGQAGDATDADNGDMTANDRRSGQAWADDDSPADQLTQQGMRNGGEAGQPGTDRNGRDAAAMTGQDQQSWTEDNNLVGQDVYAQDETRLGSVGRVQQDGEGTEAEPIALIIVTDTMGEREVSLEDRTWSNQEREGETSLMLDYQDQNEFQQDSSPYSDEPDMTGDAQDYGQSQDVTDQQGEYGAAGDDDAADADRWTDDHPWIDTAVYSRTGSQIGEVERVRGGATGGQPTAIVLETNGFLDIGGREVELNGSNFRLTDYEGEQVLQIRYTEDEVDQMKSFNEAETSDYPLSDNPLEDDASEPADDGTR